MGSMEPYGQGYTVWDASFSEYQVKTTTAIIITEAARPVGCTQHLPRAGPCFQYSLFYKAPHLTAEHVGRRGGTQPPGGRTVQARQPSRRSQPPRTRKSHN